MALAASAEAAVAAVVAVRAWQPQIRLRNLLPFPRPQPEDRSWPAKPNFRPATRNSQFSSTFAQRMFRSELPPAQNALADSVKKIETPSSQVLASFQIERTGEQVRIVDADGSAYEGRVVTPELLDKLQAADLAERRAAKDAGVPPGAANAAGAAQQNAYSGNFAAQKNGYVDAQANAGELPPKSAIYDNAAQNQAPAPGADLAKWAGAPQAGDGSGFAFQVSGLNRKLNHPSPSWEAVSMCRCNRAHLWPSGICPINPRHWPAIMRP